MLYRVTMSVFAGRNIALRPMPDNVDANITMRGHVRTLTNADAALFAPPSGYARISAEESGTRATRRTP